MDAVSRAVVNPISSRALACPTEVNAPLDIPTERSTLWRPDVVSASPTIIVPTELGASSPLAMSLPRNPTPEANGRPNDAVEMPLLHVDDFGAAQALAGNPDYVQIVKIGPGSYDFIVPGYSVDLTFSNKGTTIHVIGVPGEHHLLSNHFMGYW